jgi:ankyrin repeat protein
LLRAAGVRYCPTRNGLETVQALLAHGADVNAKDNFGWTALMYAKEMGYVETIRMLKKAGAK